MSASGYNHRDRVIDTALRLMHKPGWAHVSDAMIVSEATRMVEAIETEYDRRLPESAEDEARSYMASWDNAGPT